MNQCLFMDRRLRLGGVTCLLTCSWGVEVAAMRCVSVLIGAPFSFTQTTTSRGIDGRHPSGATLGLAISIQYQSILHLP